MRILSKYTLWCYMLFCTCLCYAQNKKIDSLLKLIKTDKEDTNKAKHLFHLCRENRLISEYDKGLSFGKQAIALAQTLNFKKVISDAYNNIGIIYKEQNNFPEALKNYFAALKIYEEIKYKKGVANAYNNIGIIYHERGNYPEALKNYFAALKIYEEIKDKDGIASSYNNIGNIYRNQGNYPEAIKNNFAALKIREETKNIRDIASSYNNIAVIYKDEGNFSEALKNYFAALKIYEEIKDKKGIAYSYNGIGSIYKDQGNFPEALKNYFAALKIGEEIGDKNCNVLSYPNIGNVYTKLNKTKEAQDYLNKGLALSKEIGSIDYSKEICALLAILDSTNGNYKAAFEHHKLYIIYRDSLDNEETKKKSLQAGMQYEFDKKEIAAKAEQERLDAITAEVKQKQQIVIYAVAGVLLLVIVFSLFLFNRFRITQKQKQVIEQQKVLVDEAYESLHEKNKEVMDSINYASRIQRALLPSVRYIENSLNRLTKNVSGN